MLSKLHLKQFTVFKDVEFNFSPGLNVIVGDNGTGKTHVLKLGYLFCCAWPDLTAKRLRVNTQHAEVYLDERLTGLFRVSSLDALVRQGHQSEAQLIAQVSGHIPTLQFHMAHEAAPSSPGLPEAMPWDIQIQRSQEASAATLKANVVPDAAAVNAFLPRQVFVPSKEMVSLFKGLIGLFEKYREFPLDETYLDLAVNMSVLEPREVPALLPDVMQQIQQVLGGHLKLDNGDLVFERSDGSRLETSLMAEGHRKLALLIYLLRYGVVERGSTLFWDEPEANLNPAAIKLLAQALFTLAGLGVQVILATHSLFLLREFEILTLSADFSKVSKKYFALSCSPNNAEGVAISVGDTMTDIEPLVLLDENLSQSDRYLDLP